MLDDTEELSDNHEEKMEHGHSGKDGTGLWVRREQKYRRLATPIPLSQWAHDLPASSMKECEKHSQLARTFVAMLENPYPVGGRIAILRCRRIMTLLETECARTLLETSFCDYEDLCDTYMERYETLVSNMPPAQHGFTIMSKPCMSDVYECDTDKVSTDDDAEALHSGLMSMRAHTYKWREETYAFNQIDVNTLLYAFHVVWEQLKYRPYSFTLLNKVLRRNSILRDSAMQCVIAGRVHRRIEH